MSVLGSVSLAVASVEDAHRWAVRDGPHNSCIVIAYSLHLIGRFGLRQ